MTPTTGASYARLNSAIRDCPPSTPCYPKEKDSTSFLRAIPCISSPRKIRSSSQLALSRQMKPSPWLPSQWIVSFIRSNQWLQLGGLAASKDCFIRNERRTHAVTLRHHPKGGFEAHRSFGSIQNGLLISNEFSHKEHSRIAYGQTTAINSLQVRHTSFPYSGLHELAGKMACTT